MDGMKRNMKNKLLVSGVIFINLVVVALILALFYWRTQFIHNQDNEVSMTEYKYHYALITEERDSTFWDDIYRGASEFGAQNDAYVELMGDSLAVNYSADELFDIAICSGVDGIIIEGKDTDSQNELMARAEEKGIPVVTLLNDNYGSSRQSFVGIGNYNLGREYARELIKAGNKNVKNVVLISEDNYDDAAWNLFRNGFTETIQNEGNHMDFEARMISMDNAEELSIQQTIRNLLTEEELPDVIICLSENITVSAYQAIVNENLVGQVDIIGYYVSDTILGAISRDAIRATIVLDASDMGSMAVAALNDYKKYGHVSDYLTIEAVVINSSNIEEYMDE